MGDSMTESVLLVKCELAAIAILAEGSNLKDESINPDTRLRGNDN
jgi:hypothetical protein